MHTNSDMFSNLISTLKALDTKTEGLSPKLEVQGGEAAVFDDPESLANRIVEVIKDERGFVLNAAVDDGQSFNLKFSGAACKYSYEGDSPAIDDIADAILDIASFYIPDEDDSDKLIAHHREV